MRSLPSQEFILDKVCDLLLDSRWVPRMDPTPLLRCILTDFPISLRHTTASYRNLPRRAMTAASDLSVLDNEAREREEITTIQGDSSGWQASTNEQSSSSTQQFPNFLKNMNLN